MKDVNNDISDINATIAGSGLTMDQIHNGSGLGIAAGGDFNNPVTIGFGYDRLFASSEVGDATGSIKYDFPSNAFRIFAEYRLASTGQFLPRLGIAEGLVTASGSVSVSISGSGSASADVSGNGPLTEVYAGGDLRAAPTFFITTSVGYRYAKVGEVKLNDQTLYNLDGSKYTLDYSGLLARFGIKVAFMQ